MMDRPYFSYMPSSLETAFLIIWQGFPFHDQLQDRKIYWNLCFLRIMAEMYVDIVQIHSASLFPNTLAYNSNVSSQLTVNAINLQLQNNCLNIWSSLFQNFYFKNFYSLSPFFKFLHIQSIDLLSTSLFKRVLDPVKMANKIRRHTLLSWRYADTLYCHKSLTMSSSSPISHVDMLLWSNCDKTRDKTCEALETVVLISRGVTCFH